MFLIYKKKDFLKLSKVILIILSVISFIIASKGFSILYLFLLADLLCCAAVFTIFYGFYKKKINKNSASIAIIVGLLMGFLLFPNQDFSQSILVGTLLSKHYFSAIISNYLLFWSFLLATVAPVIVIIGYDSFKR